MFGSLLDEEGFWVYISLDRTFGAPDMASGDLRVTARNLVLVLVSIMAVLLLPLLLLVV